MFVILTYDVNRRRDKKVLRVCRKYLYRVQNSVFEGPITESMLKKLKSELEKQIDTQQDSVQIYRLDSPASAVRERLGVLPDDLNIIG